VRIADPGEASSGRTGVVAWSLPMYGTHTRQGDALVFTFGDTRLRTRALLWLALLVTVAAIAWAVSMPFLGGLRTYRCDLAAGVCADTASGRIVARVADIESVKRDVLVDSFASEFGDGAQLTLRTGASVVICRSASETGGEPLTRVLGKLRAFVAHPREPVKVTCMEGRGTILGSLFALGLFLPALFIPIAIGRKRPLRGVTFDRAARVVRLRHSAKLRPFGRSVREVPFARIARFDVTRVTPRGGGGDVLWLNLHVDAVPPRVVLAQQPDSPAERRELEALKAELEVFVASA
jgi:hypothetical protein